MADPETETELVSPSALRRPAPPIQLRLALMRVRSTGQAFDEAWKWAMKQVIWPHDTVHRQQWRAALNATRHEWRAAYEGTQTPTSALLRDFRPDVFMFDLIEDDDAGAAVIG